jgi:hypothetical protein
LRKWLLVPIGRFGKQKYKRVQKKTNKRGRRYTPPTQHTRKAQKVKRSVPSREALDKEMERYWAAAGKICL